MDFRIMGLGPEPFRPLFALGDDELKHCNAVRMIVDEHPGFPDRILMRDGPVGEEVILVNHVSQPAETPYRWSDGTDRRPKSRRIEIEEDAYAAELAYLRVDICGRNLTPFSRTRYRQSCVATCKPNALSNVPCDASIGACQRSVIALSLPSVRLP